MLFERIGLKEKNLKKQAICEQLMQLIKKKLLLSWENNKFWLKPNTIIEVFHYCDKKKKHMNHICARIILAVIDEPKSPRIVNLIIRWLLGTYYLGEEKKSYIKNMHDEQK